MKRVLQAAVLILALGALVQSLAFAVDQKGNSTKGATQADKSKGQGKSGTHSFDANSPGI